MHPTHAQLTDATERFVALNYAAKMVAEEEALKIKVPPAVDKSNNPEIVAVARGLLKLLRIQGGPLISARLNNAWYLTDANRLDELMMDIELAVYSVSVPLINYVLALEACRTAHHHHQELQKAKSELCDRVNQSVRLNDTATLGKWRTYVARNWSAVDKNDAVPAEKLKDMRLAFIATIYPQSCAVG